MVIKWNKAAIQQLFEVILFLEETGFYTSAEHIESDILSKIRSLPLDPLIYPPDTYRKNNDGSYRAFEVDHYRVTYRETKDTIRIVRIKHTSRRIRKY